MHHNNFKIIIIGDSAVGKTALVYKYINQNNPLPLVPTIGVSFYNKKILFEDKEIMLQIWDTAGQERFKSMTRLYYKGSRGCLCVFDVTSRKTFEQLDFWINDYYKYNPHSKILIFVANKIDRPESEWKVNKNEIEELAKKHDCPYMLTSCITGTNINELFNLLIEKMIENEKLMEEIENDKNKKSQNVNLLDYLYFGLPKIDFNNFTHRC